MRPEQLKAREYLNRKGTLLPAPQIRERVGAAFAALEAALDEISETQARQRAIPGEWTVQEVVDHLLATHRPSVEELRDLLAGRRPAGGPIPASLQSADPMGRDWKELVADLKAAHSEVLETLAAAPDRMTDARAPVVMVINIDGPDGRQAPLHWIEELDWKAYAVIFRMHELDHLNQIKKTLKACRGA